MDTDTLEQTRQGLRRFVRERLVPLEKQVAEEDKVPADIRSAFASTNVKVFDDRQKLEDFLAGQSWKNKNLLMMSSGNFGGINLPSLAEKLLS